MERYLSLAVVALLVVSAVACQPGPAGLSDQDEAAIKKLCDDAATMVNTQQKTDWAAYAQAYYAEDATVMAADASPEIKRLGDIVGTLRFDGTFDPDPKAPAGPLAMTTTCGWSTGGTHVICRFSGTMAGAAFDELFANVYDARTSSYAFYSRSSDRTNVVGRIAITPGTWVYSSEPMVDGRPAKSKWTRSDMSPAGGAWKYELSVAGGPWTVVGEGKFVAVK